jgi:hypothetical protein
VLKKVKAIATFEASGLYSELGSYFASCMDRFDKISPFVFVFQRQGDQVSRQKNNQIVPQPIFVKINM